MTTPSNLDLPQAVIDAFIAEGLRFAAMAPDCTSPAGKTDSSLGLAALVESEQAGCIPHVAFMMFVSPSGNWRSRCADRRSHDVSLPFGEPLWGVISGRSERKG